MLGVQEGFKKGRFYAKFYADFYANLRQALYFGLFFMGIFMLILKVSSLFCLITSMISRGTLELQLFILPRNIHDIKRHPRVAVHLQCSTNGLFVNKCTSNCHVIMLRSLLTHHKETIKDQRVHIFYLFCWVLGNRS